MKIVCAPDSFKESMTAQQAGEAMARGIQSVDPGIEVVLIPMADGGEGTMDALIAGLRGEVIGVDCHDALGRPHAGSIGWIADRKLAIVEVAQAVGLGLIEPADRNPLAASSTGVGELLLAVLDLGASEIIVGLGGSATNDGGAGLLGALGADLLDAAGRPISPCPQQFSELESVSLQGLNARLRDVQVTLACDVTNPLLGSHGATRTFGPQKGASAADLDTLEAALTSWIDLLEPASGRQVRNLPGAGAAGGLGAAFLSLPRVAMEPGVELVARVSGLADAVAHADWVFTGEGGIDGQTRFGKTPWGVAQVARAHGVPTVLFGGRVSNDADSLLGDGIVAILPITPFPNELSRALAEGPQNLERAVRMACGLITARPT